MKESKYRLWPGVILALLMLACSLVPVSADDAVTDPAPDLVVEAISWSPQSPSIGDTVIFTVTIGNQGSIAEGSSRVDYYIDDELLESDSIASVGAGAVLTQTFTWVAEAGSHTVMAVADAAGAVAESDEGNNSTNFAFPVLAPDLLVESIVWSPEPPSVDDSVSFNMTVKNQGNSPARFSQVKIYVDGEYRDYCEVPRLDAGDNFTFTYVWKARVGSHEVKAIADALGHVVESDEDNNAGVEVCSTAAPDLIIGDVTWTPENPTENTTATVSIIVSNQGLGMADSSYLSYTLDGMSQYSVCLGQIEAGENDTATFLWPVRSGYHTVCAVADVNDKIVESDETNNALTVPLPSPSPDLVIESITWSPSSPVVRRWVTFTIEVKNQGKSTASQSYLYLNIEGYDPYQLSVPELASGITTEVTLPWRVINEQCTVEAVADAEDLVAESNEENNTKTVNLTAAASGSKPDLVIESITWSPSSPAVGDKVTFTVSVSNDGEALATPSHVAYYIDDVWQDSDYIEQLEAGESVTATFDMVAAGGTHTFSAVADINEAVAESIGANNEKAVTFSVPAPDLAIKGISWSPLNPSAGEVVDFTVTVENRGIISAASCDIDYYVDGTSRGSHNIMEIAAGATATTVFTWTAQAGSHVIEVVADGQDRMAEIDETNNRREVAIPAPDLVIQDITWSPENPSENATVTFTVTTGNLGAGGAGGSGVYFYVDDVEEGYQSLAAIGNGAAATAVFTWIAQEGSHVFRVATDGEDLVTEIDESNNEEAVTLSVLALSADAGIPASEDGAAAGTVAEEEDAVVSPADAEAAAVAALLADAAVEADEAPWQRALSKWWPAIAVVLVISIAVSAFIFLRGRVNISLSIGKSAPAEKSPPPKQAPGAGTPSGG